MTRHEPEAGGTAIAFPGPESAAEDRDRASPRSRAEVARGTRHLMHVFPAFELGGVAIRISNIINHFGDRYRHTILSLNSCLDCRVRIDPEIEVRYQGARMSRYNLLSNIAAYRAITRRAAPDLLLTYNWGAVEWALSNTLWPICPNVHFESGFGPEEADGQIARRVLFRRLALARSVRVVVPSRTLVDIASRQWRVGREKLTYIPNGVDLTRFATAERGAIEAFAGLGPKDLVIGTVAPLRREKNLGRLLRAFARLELPDRAVLAIVGDGGERPSLERLAGELGVAERVVFTGHLEQVEEALPWFDVFALTSDTEQMPNALIQAMAAGRPVAAVDVGDVKHILSPENRDLVADKTDDEALVEAMKRLLMDAGLRRRLGGCNQERVHNRFTQDRMFGAYARLFNGLLP